MATAIQSLIIFLSVCVSSGYASFCYRSYNYIYYYYTYYTYCPFGCCGYYGNEYCCSYAGPIAGIIFAMIAFISIIIALIICRRRRLATSGVVVTTGGVANAGFVSTSTMQQGAVVHAPTPQYPGQYQGQYPGQYHNQYPAQYLAYQQPPAYAPK